MPEMTALVFGLLGAGLMLLRPPDPTRARLAWLAADRLASSTAPWPRRSVAQCASEGSASEGAAATATGRPRLIMTGDRPFSRRQTHLGWAALGLGAVGVFALGGLVPAALWVVAGGVLQRCGSLLLSGRALAQRRAELVTAVAALDADYASGATVEGAFKAAASVSEYYRPTFQVAAGQAALGQDVCPVLYDDLGGGGADPGLVGLGLASRVAGRAGAPLSVLLRGVRADLIADREIRRAVSAALTGPRTSAILLALLPLVGLGMGEAMGARPDQVLLRSGPGQVALILGVSLDLVGIVWTMALTQRVQP
ncbi:MAG: tight adherence protein [Pseudonocardiales bacterium]|nr:tight adherence protein [Pseudonocardiales bacterium]